MRNRRKREKDSPDAKPRSKEEKPEIKKAEHDKPAAPAPSSPSVDPTRIGNYVSTSHRLRVSSLTSLCCEISNLGIPLVEALLGECGKG